MTENYIHITRERPIPNAKAVGYMIRSEYPIRYPEGKRTEQWVKDYHTLMETFRVVSGQMRNSQIVFSNDIRNSQRKELTDILTKG